MRSKPPRRDVPFFADVGIALALVLTIAFFVLVMEKRFGVAGSDPDQLPYDSHVVVAHGPAANKHN